MKLENILTALMIAFFGSIIIFFLLDMSLGHKGSSTELIYEKEIKPAYTEFVGKNHYPRHHPEEYILYLKDYYGRRKIEVRSTTFYDVDINQEVNTVFLVGKWTKIRYFQRVVI
ncbi:MAG: hypothetical protein LCH91_14135 [Bacteroidetes bacterium]|nr:hypothetical protein [Bacteroidota bacterium]